MLLFFMLFLFSPSNTASQYKDHHYLYSECFYFVSSSLLHQNALLCSDKNVPPMTWRMRVRQHTVTIQLTFFCIVLDSIPKCIFTFKFNITLIIAITFCNKQFICSTIYSKRLCNKHPSLEQIMILCNVE